MSSSDLRSLQLTILNSHSLNVTFSKRWVFEIKFLMFSNLNRVDSTRKKLILFGANVFRDLIRLNDITYYGKVNYTIIPNENNKMSRGFFYPYIVKAWCDIIHFEKYFLFKFFFLIIVRKKINIDFSEERNHF